MDSLARLEQEDFQDSKGHQDFRSEMGDRGSRGPTARGPKGQPGPPGLPASELGACLLTNPNHSTGLIRIDGDSHWGHMSQRVHVGLGGQEGLEK
ncbi:hypothetical protein INR49_009878 [Caranx melampygus]|nr:hypothetical protein INR49_009878 [Caranx melampygus]